MLVACIIACLTIIFIFIKANEDGKLSELNRGGNESVIQK